MKRIKRFSKSQSTSKFNTWVLKWKHLCKYSTRTANLGRSRRTIILFLLSHANKCISHVMDLWWKTKTKEKKNEWANYSKTATVKPENQLIFINFEESSKQKWTSENHFASILFSFQFHYSTIYFHFLVDVKRTSYI